MFLINGIALLGAEPENQCSSPVPNHFFARLRGFLRQQCASLTVALVLMVARMGRASGEEDQFGYRREMYREDGDRMSIDTDSLLLDVGLGSQLRVKGSFVIDTISGATPNGAPPQAQWPFASFSALYNRAYGQAYTAQFNQFVTQNQIYVDAGYETYQQMTNQAAQFAQQTAAPIATNSASASYQSLTNNPNYRRTSVPLTTLHDRREAYSIELPFTWGIQQLSPSFSHSRESDYISFGGALNYSVALNQKNTTINLGYSHNSDSVRDDRMVWEDKRTDTFLVGVDQLLSPKAYLTLNFVYNNDYGYLSDPYRGVMAAANFPQFNPDDPALIPESRPRHRGSEVGYISYTQFIDPLQGSVEANYRLFHDSWGITSHTMGLTWRQKIGRNIVLSPSFRYTYQSAAAFYYLMVPDYSHLPSYYSSDYRLSELNTFEYGLDFTYRITRFLSLDAGYLRYVMKGLDGATSQSAYPSANVFSLGLRIWF
jgi:hypothetical protein